MGDIADIFRILGFGRPSGGGGTPGVFDKTIEGVAEAIREGRCKNIIVMTGAGISVAAGIPDFRSPGTGLYSQLGKYNLSRPESIFEIKFFKQNPKPFCLLAKELYPGKFTPTHTHHFINLLHQKGVLVRNYTQNIDTLERIAGVPAEKLVEAHGSFGTSHCIDCRKEYALEFVRDAVFKDEVPECTECHGLVKPDIVFFGEPLPSRFFDFQDDDFKKCDLLIIIGTSLAVYPFASLINKANKSTSRVLINRDDVGPFDYTGPTDVFLQGNDCQNVVTKLVELIGWKDDLDKLINNFTVPDNFSVDKHEEEANKKEEKGEQTKHEAEPKKEVKKKEEEKVDKHEAEPKIEEAKKAEEKNEEKDEEKRKEEAGKKPQESGGEEREKEEQTTKE